MYAAAIVAVAAAALLARRQNGAMVVSPRFASTSKAPPAVLAEAPVQPVETNSAIQFNDNSADRVAAQRSGEISKSLRPEEHLLPNPAPAIGALSRPVPKSPDLSALNEPPVITGTQTNEFLDKGIFRVSLPAPAPPVTTIGGNLQPPEIVSSPPLTSSLVERTGKIQGVVIIDALIDDKGRATDMKVVSGFPRLTEVAMEALRSWKFEPARLNGQPIAMRTKVSVDFRLH
jgi:TonB family protein